MTKSNITHITFFVITSVFLFFSFLSTSHATSEAKTSLSVAINKGKTVKQVINKVKQGLVKKDYKLQRGNVHHISTVAKKGVKMVANGIRIIIVCEGFTLNEELLQCKAVRY